MYTDTAKSRGLQKVDVHLQKVVAGARYRKFDIEAEVPSPDLVKGLGHPAERRRSPHEGIGGCWAQGSGPKWTKAGAGAEAVAVKGSSAESGSSYGLVPRMQGWSGACTRLVREASRRAKVLVQCHDDVVLILGEQV